MMLKRSTWLHALACGLAFIVLFATAPPGFAISVNKDGGADPEVQDRIEDAQNQLPDSLPPSGAGQTATIRGSVFYNDQRTDDGLWADRRYPTAARA
jgi:hypothetical protein